MANGVYGIPNINTVKDSVIANSKPLIWIDLTKQKGAIDSVITTIPNFGVSSNPFIQYSSSGPSLKLFNGIRCAYFGGAVNQTLTTTNAVAQFTNTSQCTIIAVMIPTTTSGIIFQNRLANENNNQYNIQLRLNNTSCQGVLNKTGVQSYATTVSINTPKRPHVQTLNFDVNTPSIIVASKFKNTGTTASGITTYGNDKFVLGAGLQGTNNYQPATGYIALLLFWHRLLSAAEARNIEAHLIRRFGGIAII